MSRDDGELLVIIRLESNSTLTCIPDECLSSPNLHPAFVRRVYLSCEHQLRHSRTPSILLLLPKLPSFNSIIQEDVLPLPQCMNPIKSAPEVWPQEKQNKQSIKLQGKARFVLIEHAPICRDVCIICNITITQERDFVVGTTSVRACCEVQHCQQSSPQRTHELK